MAGVTPLEVTPSNLLVQVIDQLESVLLGKREQLTLALACMLGRGHLLIEDVPGVGKTTLAHALSATLGMDWKRVQFTSDLLPADVIGVSILDTRDNSFYFQKGPVFTSILLADEINRAPPRAQSALLEAMEERQVTVDGVTHALDEAFFVIATQNPADQQG
ncbi:MAG: AAA family ATPase, partial [Pseudomonadota bacterium]